MYYEEQCTNGQWYCKTTPNGEWAKIEKPRRLNREGFMKVEIRLIGCDDETLIDLECDEHHYEFLKVIAQKSKDTSTCDCMPVMKIKKSG